MDRDYPSGPMIKNPPCNAGDVGSIPGLGTKMPHAMGQLSPCAVTTELTATTRQAMQCNKGSA